FTLTGTGGVAPYTFSGTLSKGLSLASNGAITGTASHSGTTASTSWTVTITDANGQSRGQTLTITFARAPSLIADGTSFYATRGVAFFTDFNSIYGHPPVTFGLNSGSLPSGLSISSGSGNLGGTTSASAGTYNFTVKATDSEGNIGTTAASSISLAN